MINWQKTTLSNGLRIISAPLSHTKAVSILISVGVGSRYEIKSQNGLSHFLEHMFFKGTKKRPKTIDIARELDLVGAGYNAYTSEEETCFYVRSLSQHFDLALDVLFDILFNSKFDSKEIEKEKGVICEEIKMYQDLPQRYVHDLAKELFYGNTPLGRSTAGTIDLVKKFSRQDFLNYKKTFYNPNNMVITVAGDKSKFNWIKIIEQKFNAIKNQDLQSFQAIKEIQNKPQSLVYNKKTDQAHLVLGVRTFSRKDPRRYALKIINNILGETMGSRLFTEVREKRGLAYYVSSDINEFQDAGYLFANAGVDTKRADSAIKVILDEFSRIKKNGVTQKELDHAKENLKGRFYLGLEDSLEVASFLGEQELYWQSIESPEEIINNLFKVNLKDVAALGKEIFTDKNLNLTIIGPYENKNQFDKILKIK